MIIELHEVESSNIAQIGYDAATQTLRVRFKSGATWDYSPVPPKTWGGMLYSCSDGRSVGKFFAREIRANKDYTATEVLEDMEDTA